MCRPHSHGPGLVQDVERACGADAVSRCRVFDAALHRGQRAQVKDHLHPVRGPGHGGRVGQVGLDEFGRGPDRGQVDAQAGAEVVQHAYPPALGRQPLHQV